MRTFTYFILILIIFLAPNWSVIAQESSESQDAILVIFRKRTLNFTEFRINGNETILIPDVKTNTYYIFKVKPGKIHLKTEGNVLRNLSESKSYSLTLEAGNTYYLEALVEYQFLLTSLHLIRRSVPVGEKAIRKMNGVMVSIQPPGHVPIEF